MNIVVVAFLTDPNTALPVQVKEVIQARDVLDAASMMLDTIERMYGNKIENVSFNAKLETHGGAALMSEEPIKEAA